MSYTTDAKIYHIYLRGQDTATVIARTVEDALHELKYLELDRDPTLGARVEVVPPTRELCILYRDPHEVDEIYDDFLGISKEIKPGFALEEDDDGKFVVGTADRWAEAFAEHCPHILCSTIK